MSPEYLGPLLPDGEIEKFVRARVCARCYGDLRISEAPGRLWLADCPRCGTAWKGATVSRKYAEGLGQKGLAEAREVKANLPDLFPNVHRGKSTRQVLNELGFD